ncbi:MAG TPA: glycan-binding surface protein [Puia sp.]|jgi:hypothetical protein|nr:glycan-binding surface protein [Puia sp.]
MNSLFSSFNKRNLFLLLITAAVIHAGCKKESQGTPTIKAVRLDDSTHRDSTFTKAFPGTLVVIEGSGFSGTTNVYFNDMDAPFNVAIMSDKNIIIRIPANAPTKATDPNVTSMLKVVTTHGTANYAFELLAPAPIITSVSNENALAGETITLTGSNFYLVSQIVFPGNIAVTQFTATPDGKQIVVTVPTGITTGAPLQVVAQFGTGSSLFAFDNFNSPGPGFLANFENGDSHMGWQYWGGNQTNDATKFPNNTGYYIEIHPSSAINAGDGSWYSDNRAVMVNSSPWVTNMSDPIANYALKFEMYVLSSWTSGSLMITTSAQINPPSNTNWSYLARYAPWQSASSGDAKTSGWVTVSIPLTTFLSTNNGSYNASGSPAANFTALMGGTSSAIQIMLYNDGTTPLPAFDAAFDNVRIERIQ